MQIKILAVNPVETRQGPKKQYRVFKLNYSVDQQSRDKDIMEFSPVFKILKGAQPGELYNIDATKNSAGYVDWNNATKAGEGAPTGASEVREVSKKGTWETPEERALKQQSIIRQSCLANSLKYYEGRFEAITPEQVMGLAATFVEWVNATGGDDFQDDVIE
jgi:hypothetical protein